MAMSISTYPIGLMLDVVFPDFQATLTLFSETMLKFEIKEGPFARSETVETQVIRATDRAVRYDPADLEAFAADRRRRSTSEDACAALNR
jgi:hypothetical protein